MTELRAYCFTLLLDGIEDIGHELEDDLASAGCNDALIGKRNGLVFLDFDREGESPEKAILSAIRAVEGSRIGATVARIEPGDLVTQAEIARRTGRPRETVRLWIEGQRGPAGFPRPCSGVAGKSLEWRWVDVARWLSTNDRLDDSGDVAFAEAVARINGALDFRRNKIAYLEELRLLAG